jgi:hypothetical protein
MEDPFGKEHLVVVLAAVVAAAVCACTSSSAPPPPAPPVGTSAAPPAPSAPAASTLTGTALFCAYGGVGTTPDPLPPGYETEFAAIVVELDNAGPAIADVTVLAAALVDATGATTASLRRVDHIVVMPPLATPGPTLGTFAVYLNPEGTPFDGRLEPGRTRLRIRFSLDHAPTAMPARCRLELGAPGPSPLVIDGGVDGSWPT